MPDQAELLSSAEPPHLRLFTLPTNKEQEPCPSRT